MKQSESLSREKWPNIFLFSLLVALAAQFNINLFASDFKISIAVICLPAFLFLVRDFLLLPVTFLSGICIYLSRILLYWFRNGVIEHSYKAYFPEMIFYFVYGLCLYLYVAKRRRELSANALVLPLFLMDYISNFVELLLRPGVDAFDLRTQLSILLVAALRTLIVWMILTIFDRYRLTLLTREHAERYQRLMVLISRLNSEVVWMKKNTNLIEDTMNTSYRLFHKIQDSGLSEELSDSALSVARDIHEIKKEYLLIMRGLSDALHTEITDEGMFVSQILELLSNAISIEGKDKDISVDISINCEKTLYTDKHYSLLSVFHNLFANALEAAASDVLSIQAVQSENEDSYVFEVRDNGPGVDISDADQIFDVGFSTKIDYTTGTINRGLGLNIVRDIIEHQFNGHIELKSKPQNTVFSIYIPKNALEVKIL